MYKKSTCHVLFIHKDYLTVCYYISVYQILGNYTKSFAKTKSFDAKTGEMKCGVQMKYIGLRSLNKKRKHVTTLKTNTFKNRS